MSGILFFIFASCEPLIHCVGYSWTWYYKYLLDKLFLRSANKVFGLIPVVPYEELFSTILQLRNMLNRSCLYSKYTLSRRMKMIHELLKNKDINAVCFFWIILNKFSTLGDNSHTLNFWLVAHVLIRRNPMMLWGLLTSYTFLRPCFFLL